MSTLLARSYVQYNATSTKSNIPKITDDNPRLRVDRGFAGAFVPLSLHVPDLSQGFRVRLGLASSTLLSRAGTTPGPHYCPEQ